MCWCFAHLQCIGSWQRKCFYSIFTLQMLAQLALCTVRQINLLLCWDHSASNLGVRHASQLAIVAYTLFSLFILRQLLSHFLAKGQSNYFSETYAKPEQAPRGITAEHPLKTEV